MAPVGESEDSVSAARGMPVESTFEVTHLPARSFPAAEDVAGQGAPLERGDCPPSPFSWEYYKPVIRRLYVDEKRTLREVMDILENDFGFKATYVCPAGV